LGKLSYWRAATPSDGNRHTLLKTDNMETLQLIKEQHLKKLLPDDGRKNRLAFLKAFKARE
jgi:hypothetical protein